jgi:hypothetical protein
MNLQLANVISDLSGVTGRKIVRAIIAGERDPHQLAKLRDARIQASHYEIAKSLEGNWRPELVFGSPARPTGLSHAEVRTTIHRQRHGALRPEIP